MSSPRFLNVDLDLTAHADPSPIIAHWADDMFVLVTPQDTGTSFVRFELTVSYSSADETIAHFCSLVETLPPEMAVFWQKCPVRRLDIGYEGGTQRPEIIETLPTDLLVRVTRQFTGIGIVIYPV